MYQWLVQLNKNYGRAIDEKDSVSIISKDCDDYSFEDILEKENELEQLDLDLNANRNALSGLKSKTI